MQLAPPAYDRHQLPPGRILHIGEQNVTNLDPISGKGQMATDPTDRDTRKIVNVVTWCKCGGTAWGTEGLFWLVNVISASSRSTQISPCPTGGQVVQTDWSLAGGGLPGGGHSCQMTTVLTTTVTTVGPSTTSPYSPKMCLSCLFTAPACSWQCGVD